MKKFLKIFAISLGSLILLLTIVISILLWIVFTPERLTPIVRNQMSNFITVESRIERVELTFFSTFPNFKLRIDDFALISPINRGLSEPIDEVRVFDTPIEQLLSVERMEAKVDIRALLRDNELQIGGISLMNGTVFMFTNSEGDVNFDIFPPSEPDTTAFELPFGLVNLSQIELKNINFIYIDEFSGTDFFVYELSANINATIRALDDLDVSLELPKPFCIFYADNSDESALMETRIDNLSGKINASVRTMENIKADVALNPFDIDFVDYGSMDIQIRNFAPTLTVAMQKQDDARAKLDISPFSLSFRMDGEQYLLKENVAINGVADIVLSRQLINFENLTASLNDLEISLKGSIENDTLNGNILTDISYSLQSWNISDLLALVPASFEHYLEGIDVAGQISSNGTITGVYSENSMPLLDAQVLLANGTVRYPEMLPFPLHGIFGDVNIHTDLKNNATSFVRINNFRAQTPQSSFQTAGRVSRLFSDPFLNLTTRANLTLAEFNSMIPDSLKTTVKGNVIGTVRTELRLSQIETMALEKMKI
jgi:hypothetical protein